MRIAAPRQLGLLLISMAPLALLSRARESTLIETNEHANAPQNAHGTVTFFFLHLKRAGRAPSCAHARALGLGWRVSWRTRHGCRSVRRLSGRWLPLILDRILWRTSSTSALTTPHASVSFEIAPAEDCCLLFLLATFARCGRWRALVGRESRAAEVVHGMARFAFGGYSVASHLAAVVGS